MRRSSAPRLLAFALALAGLCACATAQPTTASSRKTTTAAAHQVPTMPAHVHLPMPPSVRAMMGGTKVDSLIEGSGIVAQGGGNIVAQGGGNIILNGGGNLTAKRSLLADCAPETTGKDYFTGIMSLALSPYAETVLIINGILDRALAGGLEQDTPKTIDDPRGTGKLTVVLSTTGSVGVLRVAEGTAYHAADQIMGLAFTGPTHGVAVYRSQALDPQLGHLAIATHFDLSAGKVSADGLADPTVLPNAQTSTIYRAHWEFATPAAPTANDPTFTMRVGAFIHDSEKPCNTAPVAVCANFLASGEAAARMGRVLPGNTTISYTRNDGTGYDPSASDADDFFLAKDGSNLDAASASAALEALAPTPGVFPTSYPPDPGVGTPYADPTFAFPDGSGTI